MKALRYLGPSRLEMQEVPDVFPQKGEVLLKVKACGICGSDVYGYLGLTGRRIAPMTMRHEFAAEAAEFGEVVDIMGSGKMNAAKLISKVVSMEDAKAVMEDLHTKPDKFIKIIIDPAK